MRAYSKVAREDGDLMDGSKYLTGFNIAYCSIHYQEHNYDVNGLPFANDIAV